MRDKILYKLLRETPHELLSIILDYQKSMYKLLRRRRALREYHVMPPVLYINGRFVYNL